MKNSSKHPPKSFLKFFRWFCHPKLRDSIEGDLMELYQERRAENGKLKADLKFVRDVLLLFRPSIIKPIEGYQNLNNYGMIKSYFAIGWRNILKYKVFSFINVFGLAVAMSVCMLIILMLADQKSYDQFHQKKNNIYRVLTKIPKSLKPNASSPFPLASSIKSDYPIIADATHLVPGVGGDAIYQQKATEMRGFFADASFFDVFSFELEKGNKQNALSLPQSMIITTEIAHRLFNGEEPIGKTVEFINRGLSHLKVDGETTPSNWGIFTITGVIDAQKYKSHIQFGVLISNSSIKSLAVDGKFKDMTDNWQEYSNCYSYVLLHPESKSEDLTTALNDLTARKYKDNAELKNLKLVAQNLMDITPGIFVGNPISFSLPIEVYYFLTFLALGIMLSAGVNYTNLSTARALTRAKEIGVRKVTGARRKDLIFQFLSESVLISFLSLVLAMILLLFVKPAFKGLWVNNYLNFELHENSTVYFYFILFALLVGLLAGIYPAFRLSRLQPILAIQKKESVPSKKWGMQKFLSVSQFIVSLFFITTSILLYNQFKHHLAIDYGFNAKQIVNVKLQGNEYSKVSNELSKIPGVASISACDYLPATGTQNNTALKIAGSEKDYLGVTVLVTDEKFMETLELKIIAGKNLPDSSSAHNRFILLNESAIQKLGYQHPSEIVGELMEQHGSKEMVEVVGVVQDFRFRMPSEQEVIAPIMIHNRPSSFRYANLKIISNDRTATIARLEEAWKKLDPIHPLDYQFYDEQLAETNQGFVDIVSIIGSFAFLAITIACLGLLGMATYTTERRSKEIGIRKVMGAGDLSVALLLSKGFLKMLLVSICIGAPFSYFINNLWLQHFPNRVEFGFGTVLLGIFVLLGLGLVTIGSQTFRASKRNPVESLKSE
ncbi:MAG: FtsX-like permease family protein [Cyclobacteriaceae bacterium]|nr:FtsX-like permease family protein [Cyclobacteriaceae bacterium]